MKNNGVTIFSFRPPVEQLPLCIQAHYQAAKMPVHELSRMSITLLAGRLRETWEFSHGAWTLKQTGLAE